MKKVGITIFCVLFCWVVALICAPNTVKSNPLVYSTTFWCLTCHDAAYPDGNLHTVMNINCNNCHDGTPAKWNVYTSKCIACHPAGNPGRCELVLFHIAEAGGVNCSLCHQKCENCP
jgi:hypothetical protein